MSVFDAIVKTVLQTVDPKTDHKLPTPGSLSYGQITSASALASTTGHDTLLLKGDRDRQMHGNENTVIQQNRTHQVAGNQKKTISGNKDEDIFGNFLHQTTGNLHRTVVGATNDVYTAAHTIAHTADQFLQEPVNFWHNVNNTNNSGAEYAQKYGNYDSLVGSYYNVVGLNVDLKVTQLGYTGAEAVGTGPSLAKHDAKVAAGELNARFDAVYSRIGAIKPVVHLTNIKVTTVTVIVGIAVGENQAI